MCRFCLFDCQIEIEHLRSKRNPACKARLFFGFRSKSVVFIERRLGKRSFFDSFKKERSPDRSFCIPKHQHAPFSEQSLTSLPSRIIFVVRTAHILPHIEQV